MLFYPRTPARLDGREFLFLTIMEGGKVHSKNCNKDYL